MAVHEGQNKSHSTPLAALGQGQETKEHICSLSFCEGAVREVRADQGQVRVGPQPAPIRHPKPFCCIAHSAADTQRFCKAGHRAGDHVLGSRQDGSQGVALGYVAWRDGWHRRLRVHIWRQRRICTCIGRPQAESLNTALLPEKSARGSFQKWVLASIAMAMPLKQRSMHVVHALRTPRVCNGGEQGPC